MQKWVTNSQRYLVVGLVRLVGLVHLVGLGLPLMVTSRVSAMVSVRVSIK